MEHEDYIVRASKTDYLKDIFYVGCGEGGTVARQENLLDLDLESFR